MANGPSAPAITPHDANDDQMSLIDIRSRVFEPLKFFKQRVNIVDTPGHGSCSVTEACDSGNSSPPSSPKPALSATQLKLLEVPKMRVGRARESCDA
jgi:hypothetical protein